MVKNIERPDITLPHSIDAEQNVLSGIIIEPDQLPALRLKPSDFYHPWHRDIFKCMLALQRASLPLTWVRMHQELLGQPGQGDDAPTITYLSDLFSNGTTVAYLPDDASIVREKSRKRAFLQRVPLLIERSQNGTRTDALEEQWTEAVDLLKEDKPDTKQQTISLADLLAEEDEPEPWLVDHLLTRGGLSLVSGKPGAGKTTFARDMALSVAQGKPWLGRDVAQGHVVYLALEEQKMQVKHHMQLMGAKAQDEITFYLGTMHDNPMAVLARLIAQLTPTLIIIDPIARFLHCKDFNDYAQMSGALDPLIDMAHKTGAHICLIHHARKGEASADSYLGSTALSGSVDTSLIIDLDASGRRILSTIKQRGDGDAVEPIVLAVSEVTHRIEIDGSKAEAVYHDLSAEMLNLLNAGPMKNAELQKQVKGSNANKSRAVIRLEEVGKITRTPDPDGKGLICTLAQKSSSSSSQLFQEELEELNQPALPLPPLYKGGRGGADEVAKMSIIDEREKMSSEQKADEIYNNGFVWAAIAEHWPPPGIDETVTDAELTPPRGSAAYHAMLLDDLLFQRAMTPKAQGIVDKHRVKMGGKPYDSGRNAESVLEQFELLAAVA